MMEHAREKMHDKRLNYDSCPSFSLPFTKGHYRPIFLRQTFVEWANQSRHHCAWAQAYYRMQRRKGNAHPAAMRSLAFKWIRILFRCWKNREAYDEAKYVAALKRKGSPIAELLVE